MWVCCCDICLGEVVLRLIDFFLGVVVGCCVGIGCGYVCFVLLECW